MESEKPSMMARREDGFYEYRIHVTYLIAVLFAPSPMGGSPRGPIHAPRRCPPQRLMQSRGTPPHSGRLPHRAIPGGRFIPVARDGNRRYRLPIAPETSSRTALTPYIAARAQLLSDDQIRSSVWRSAAARLQARTRGRQPANPPPSSVCANL
jgi:hypothetical protein